MSVAQIVKRVARVEQALCPRHDPNKNTFTLEELCRSMWQRDKAAFLALGETFPVELFRPNFEREDALAAAAASRNRTQMRAIARRVARIEERLCPAASTEHLRRLRARLEAARQRMAKCGYTFVDVAPKSEDISGLTLIERLRRGRHRAFQAG